VRSLYLAARYRYCARCCLLAYTRHRLAGDDAPELLTEAASLLSDAHVLHAGGWVS
jgi:hypothetical protein